MSRYAQIIENEVAQIVLSEADKLGELGEGEYISVEGIEPQPQRGWRYENNEFVPLIEEVIQPVDTHRIVVELDTDKVGIGQSVAISVSIISDLTDELVPVDLTYYVPVLRESDGVQSAFLRFDFIQGAAQNSVSFEQPGMYSVALGKIEPRPTAALPDVPRITVF